MFLSAPLPDNEAERLARLRSLELLDSEPEVVFDELASAAATSSNAPIGLISLVDESRQWFKAAIGLVTGITETPREISFCAHAILDNRFFEVRDTHLDERFADNPLVTGPTNIRYYAGAVLELSDGTRLGTLCVLDRKPNALQPHQIDALKHLARAAASAIESREVSRRLVAEAQLAKAQIATLYRSTPAALFSMDTKGILLTVSDKFLDETGYTREELVGGSVFGILTPASRDKAINVGMPNFLRSGRTAGIEYEVVRKDGTVIDALVSQILERDEAGNPLRSMSVFENITPRKRAEAALLDERERLERILEGTNAGTWELRVPTGETFYNDRWAEIIGYTLEELGPFRDNRWFTFIHPLDRPRAKKAIEDHLAGRSDYYDVEFRVRHKNGSWIWTLNRGRISERAPDGTPILMHGTRIDINQRKLAEEHLRATKNFLQRVGVVAGVGGWEMDLRTQDIHWSDQTCALHDCKPGHRPTLAEAISYFSYEARATVQDAVQASIDLGTPFDLELPFVSAKGRAFWARAVGSVEFEDGVAARLVGSFQDVTARRQIEQDLARSRELLQVTLDSIGDAVITTDTKSIVQWLNPVAERMTGWTKVEAVGQPLSQIFRIIDEATRKPAQNPVSVCLDRSQIVGVTGHVNLVSRGGAEYGIEDSASPMRDADGQLLGAVLVFHDVSEQRRLNNEMSHRATHDLLTGLLNRSEFEARLTTLLDEIRTDPSHNVLLYVDLDQFKLVNDACGHGAGDQLLRQVAQILRGCVRAHDTLARLGGDEFGIVLEHCELKHAERVAQKICDQMDEFRFVHEGRRFRVGTSIGLVPVDARWSNIKAIMQAADASCYAAKEGGRNRVHAWFDSDQAVKARHGDMQWVSRMEMALDEDRFELFGQRIDPIDGHDEPIHFEVLLRMREPDGTLIGPGAFLPAAERFHMANRLDRWVVRHAFAWMGRAEEGEVEIGMMSINLSGQSLGDRAFHRDICDMVRKASFDPRKICFEVTETAAITHLTEARAFIEEIRSLGVKVALDDFGAGASSFGYLKSLPVDFLKIDGHFITNLLQDELNNAAVRCFVDVAKVVGVKTIAEFVERQDVRDCLAEIGVDMAQGYLIHKPEALESLLACRAVA